MTVAEQSLFIGGHWTPSESGATYQSVNPYTGDVATRAAAATVADVHRAVDAAQHAFDLWAAFPPHARRHYMLATDDAAEARAPRTVRRDHGGDGRTRRLGRLQRQGAL
jgi:benzaldehyde dehydrogenase (NAD)